MVSLIRALGRSHTYNLKRNRALCVGLGLGCSAGLLSSALAVATAAVGPGRELGGLPSTLVIPLFLAHPLLFGLAAGALGTVLKDLTSQARASAGLHGLTDPTTGLYSSEYMADQLRQAIARISRTCQKASILVLELEETHEDAALRSVAGAIGPLIRESDILGCIDRGRLLLIVHGDLPCALCLIQRMAQSVLQRTHLTLRAGVARWPEDGRIPSELLHSADVVLKACWNSCHTSDCQVVASSSPMTHQTSA